MNAFLTLVRKDLLLHLRTPRALVMGLVAPILIAAFFGLLFDSQRQGPSRIPVALVDGDHSTLSERFVEAMAADSTLAVEVLDAAEADRRLQHGQVRASVAVPSGFAEALVASRAAGTPRPTLRLRTDPSQQAVEPLVRGRVTMNLLAALRGRSAEADESRALPFTLVSEAVAGVGDKAYNSYAHSFAGMSVQFILFAGIEFGVGVLLARRTGLWQRYRAAPLARATLLGSRVASGALIALGSLAVIYAAAAAFFGVRISGSALGFAGIAAAFALTTGTFGLLIAALGRTPEATRSLAIVATLLMVMLGGAWVPSFIFPGWLQTVSLVVPTRWAVDGLDAMTWRGLGLEAALAPIGVMLGFSALFAAVALWRFRWEE